MLFGDRLVYAVVALAAVVIVVLPFVMLTYIKRKSQIELDHYGKYRGSAAAKSFVCPECLKRSYAPSHIARRWCSSCAKSFPEKARIARPPTGAAE
ncbi:MAG TPA: hypothetical protein VNT42_01440 [Sphingomonas sp.]|nr:hypothetical protein [Sphingomonas sp.]